jgi:hypothetical protein
LPNRPGLFPGNRLNIHDSGRGGPRPSTWNLTTPPRTQLPSALRKNRTSLIADWNVTSDIDKNPSAMHRGKLFDDDPPGPEIWEERLITGLRKTRQSFRFEKKSRISMDVSLMIRESQSMGIS